MARLRLLVGHPLFRGLHFQTICSTYVVLRSVNLCFPDTSLSTKYKYVDELIR